MQKKANNIEQKLLGTNVSDINIEKFRDLTSYNKNKYEIVGRLTIPLLKTITNKFSGTGTCYYEWQNVLSTAKHKLIVYQLVYYS